jgi:hypothetical protein
VEDSALLAYLATQCIGCDICPTSNICLGVYPSVAQHPIRQLLAAGVPVTFNSDDPPLFHTTLTDEFLALAREQAFTAAELASLVRMGVEVSFLSEAEKGALRTSMDVELADAAREAGEDLSRDDLGHVGFIRGDEKRPGPGASGVPSPNQRMVCLESHCLLAGESPVVVIAREPRRRLPGLLGDRGC